MLNIYGTRVRKDTSGNKMFDYYVSDGIYGSLNCIVYDHANPSISWLRDPSQPAVPDEEDKTVFRWTCVASCIAYHHAVSAALMLSEGFACSLR